MLVISKRRELLESPSNLAERVEKLRHASEDIGSQLTKPSLGSLEKTRLKIDFAEHKVRLAETQKQHTKAREVAKQIDAKTRRKEMLRFNEEQLKAMRSVALSRRMERPLEDDTGNLTPGPDSAQTLSKMMYNYFTGNSGTRNPWRNSSNQDPFRKDCIEAYNSRHPEKDLLWCPVLQHYFDSRDVIAAHIIPAAVDLNVINDVCGTGTGIVAYTMSKWNGIMLHRDIEKAFDKGHLLIVLKEDSNEDPFEFEIIAVDKSAPIAFDAVRGKHMCNLKALHRRKLDFRSDFRPSKRFLYFKYIVMRIKAINSGNPEELNEILPLCRRKPWPTLKSYLKKSPALRDIARYIGVEWDDAFFEDVNNLPDEDDEPEGPRWSYDIEADTRRALASVLYSDMDGAVGRREDDDDDDNKEVETYSDAVPVPS